jgi:PAS domain S-box-containing protein
VYELHQKAHKLNQLKTMFESELWQHFFAKNLSDVIWIADLDLNYIYLSPSAGVLSGYSSEELFNLTPGDILTPASMEKAIAFYGKELASEEAGPAVADRSRTLEVEQVHKNGSTVWVELNVSFVRDDSGKPIGLFGITRDIDARKKAEEALQAAQLEKELILNNLAEQVAFLNSEYRIIWANSKVIERHNLYDVQFKGQKCYELYHQLDQPCPDCPVVEVFKTGKTCSGVHRSPDGIYWQVTGIPVHDQNGEIIGAMDTALDVTDLITSRQELEKNYALLRLAGETARFGGWSVDLSNNMVTWSDQVALIHDLPIGYSPPVEEGISFYAPQWREKITAVFTTCAEEGIPYDEEMEIITAKGRRVWVRTVGEAVRDESGKIIRVEGSFQDITERKKTEQALKESEERLDLAMAVKNEGIWDWNLLTNETYFDKRYYTMAGYRPNEFPHSFNSWAELVHEEDLPKAQQAIDAYLKGKSDQFDIEFRFKKKDGQWMWINGKGKVYERDETGKPVRMIGTHTDITDRKQAEAEILRLNEELEQRVKERTSQLEAVNKELESFAYSVSHDFRAPLRALDGFSASLKEKYNEQLDEQGLHYLSRIRNAAIYMSNLVDDLLGLSRITRREFKNQQVDLSKLASEIVAELHEAESQRKARFKIAPDLQVRGDAVLLQSALHNLLENAWKFSLQEKQAKVEVGRTVIDGETVFFVRDNGVGFNMAYSDKLFGAFQRLHGVNEFPGTGIGLATVQRIINRHGGKIWAESEVGKGATFYFTLPG